MKTQNKTAADLTAYINEDDSMDGMDPVSLMESAVAEIQKLEGDAEIGRLVRQFLSNTNTDHALVIRRLAEDYCCLTIRETELANGEWHGDSPTIEGALALANHDRNQAKGSKG